MAKDEEEEDLLGRAGDGRKLSGQDNTAKAAAGQLRTIIERIETVNEDMKALQDDRKDIMAEAKGSGFDPKAIREILRLRKQEASAREEHEAIVDLYKTALGMT
jgi:uncharacterized protein (UPF0335 family)